MRGNSQVEAQVLRQADRVQDWHNLSLPFHNQSQSVWPMDNRKDSIVLHCASEYTHVKFELASAQARPVPVTRCHETSRETVFKHCKQWILYYVYKALCPQLALSTAGAGAHYMANACSCWAVGGSFQSHTFKLISFRFAWNNSKVCKDVGMYQAHSVQTPGHQEFSMESWKYSLYRFKVAVVFASFNEFFRRDTADDSAMA